MEILKRHADFESVYWLTGIKKRNDDKRDHIQHIMVKDGLMVSTDGTEIREIKTALKSGYYLISRRTKKVVSLFRKFELGEFEYPKYESILIPSENHMYIDGRKTEGNLDHGLSHIIRAMDKNTFNVSKYMALFDNYFSFDDISVDAKGNGPVILKTEGARAALMPAYS